MRTALAVGALTGFVGLLWADFRLPGGETTVYDDSREAFAQPADNLDPRSLAQFFSGDTVFNTNWVNASSIVQGRDGLGPLFNTRSCSACHFKDGRGRPPEPGEIASGLLVRISLPGETEHGGPKPHPVYGNQISVRALPGLKPEATLSVSYEEIVDAYPTGENYRIHKPIYSLSDWMQDVPDSDFQTSPRVAPSVFGLGLLESIPESRLLDMADPEDKDQDGISGRPNRVWSVAENMEMLGRFGWKANKATLLDQIAGAFQGDIGITSRLFPNENHSSLQTEAARLPSGGNPELVERDLEDALFYMRTLAPPAARFENDEAYTEGLRLFEESQCARCHIPSHTTGTDASIAALSSQTIYPYTDLLLHDMGEGLADNRSDFEANGREWRTPPLWGIGLIPKVNGHSRLLHDGRARSVEEAILWHGGEAEASKDAYMTLPREERAILIQFVSAL